MAKKEEPIANDETGKIKVKAKKEKQPDNTETKGNVTKVKEKMKMLQIPVTEKQFDTLKEKADKEKRSLPNSILIILEPYMKAK